MKYPILSFYTLLVVIFASTTLSDSQQEPGECISSPEGEVCRSENKDDKSPSQGIRVVTREELESKTGENGSEVWLSVLGEVFDVTEGKSHYGKGMSYQSLAATDCSVCYVSGVFTAEEAAKHTDEISDAMLPAVLEWLSFYGTHDSYKFVGYLIDPRFYDDKGEPTSNMIGLRKRISSIQK